MLYILNTAFLQSSQLEKKNAIKKIRRKTKYIYSAVLYLFFFNSHVSGPAQFKHTLFKDQL